MSLTNNKRRGAGWLDLAIRRRQWDLDARAPALQSANANEAMASRGHEQAEAALADALMARQGLLGGEGFSVDALIVHSSFLGEVRRDSLKKKGVLEQAAAQAQSVRADMQRVMGERDAYLKHADEARERMRREQDRSAAREIDELWLLQQASRSGGQCHEN